MVKRLEELEQKLPTLVGHPGCPRLLWWISESKLSVPDLLWDVTDILLFVSVCGNTERASLLLSDGSVTVGEQCHILIFWIIFLS